MANPDHVDKLLRGVDVWNSWRAEFPGIRPDLSDADLCDLDLTEINLTEANLEGAELFGTRFDRANLKMSNLSRAELANASLAHADAYKADLHGAFLTEANLSQINLSEANLQAADLRKANLEQANLSGATLANAQLREVSLEGADLSHADIRGADLRFARMGNCNLIGLQHGHRRMMRGLFYGIRGLDRCYGNPLFVRDASDQDYLDAFEILIDKTPSPQLRQAKRLLFRAWDLIDYGRSMARITGGGTIFAMLFGCIFMLDMKLNWGLMNYEGTAHSWFTPFYYSIVTYTTLGFGDITPKHWIGEVLVVIEVILGYMTLGLLMSVVASTVARLS